MQPFTLLDILSTAFLRYDVTNVNSYMFLSQSLEAFQNIQGKNADIPTLKAATVFKSCSQKALKSVTDVSKNT